MQQPHKRRIRTIIYIIAFMAAALGAAAWLGIRVSNAGERPRPPQAVNGVLDLTGWDLVRFGPVSLSGEWEFYWERLLTPQDFRGEHRPASTGLANLPGLWNGYKILEENAVRRLTGDGYATYRLLVKTEHRATPLALKLLDFATSYRLWVNGRLLADNGRVGTSAATAAPQALPRLVRFENDAAAVEIILQVANFTHSKGGIWTDIRLGTENQMQALREGRLSMSLFLCGGLVLMAGYHFVLFLMRRRERAPLFCALLGLLIALRTGVTGEIFLTVFFPALGWHFLYVVQYLAFYLACRYSFTSYISFTRRTSPAGWRPPPGWPAPASAFPLSSPRSRYTRGLSGTMKFTPSSFLYISLS